MPKKDTNNIAFGINTPQTTCRVFDSNEILTSPEEIDYYKTCIKEFEASNRLIGEINDNGEYMISEKIRRDLALLPKELTQNGYNLVEAFSHILTKDLYFYIEIEEVEENQIAYLYLIEKVDGYRDVQTLKSFIAKITQPKCDDFQEKARRVFNVQESISTIEEGRFINLVLQIQGRIDYWAELEDIMDLSSQIYVLRILTLLESEGEIGQKVIKEYNRRVKLEGLDGVKKKYLALRKILDESIEMYGGKEKVFVKTKEEVKTIKAEFSTPIKKVEEIRSKQMNRPIAKRVVKNAPAKAEAKPSKAGGKAAGKADKKGGGDKKGKDKKKDKGKDKEKKKDDGKKKSSGGSSKAPKLEEAKPVNKFEGETPKPADPALPKLDVFKPLTMEKPSDEDNDDEMDNVLKRIRNKGLGERSNNSNIVNTKTVYEHQGSVEPPSRINGTGEREIGI